MSEQKKVRRVVKKTIRKVVPKRIAEEESALVSGEVQEPIQNAEQFTMAKVEKKGLSISVKSFISAIAIIFGLMVATYVLTFFIPGGHYERTAEGLLTGEYQSVQGGIAWWRWLLSPFLVLGSDNGTTLIAVIIFLLVIGGVFGGLNECGLMKYMLDKITFKFSGVRYGLMAIIVFFFMAMGSLIGSFEECVPLVPIVTALAISLGWDVLTGFSMSLLAVGCGFAAGVFNPFTVGVAQELSGLAMFSGAWLRAVAFVLIYALLLGFIVLHAKKVEKPVDLTTKTNFIRDGKKDKGLIVFATILGIGIVIVLCSPFITFLQDYTMIIVAVMFLVAGVSSTLVSGMPLKRMLKTFVSGLVGMLPAVLMILMASSIKYVLEEANIMDSILHYVVGIAETLPSWSVILFIYLIVLVMNFFVASGSAKAFMLIPLIVPMAGIFGINPQLCVLAFAFGDGFSNVLYPTNPALLISLGIADLSYVKWFKHSVKFQLLNLLLTAAILMLGWAIGY